MVGEIHACHAAVVAEDGVEEAAGQEIELAPGGPAALGRAGDSGGMGKLFKRGESIQFTIARTLLLKSADPGSDS